MADGSSVKKGSSPIIYGDVPSFMATSIVGVEGLGGQDAVILGMPYDGVATFRGGATRRGSQEIRKYSLLYGGYNLDLDLNIFNYVKVADFGDVDIVPGDTVESYRRAEQKVGSILEAGAIPLVIGGDHGISIPVTSAVAKKQSKPFGVVIFDTHLDLEEALDNDLLTRASPLKRIIELTQVNPERVVIIGARGPRNTEDWVKTAREKKITYFTMKDIQDLGIEHVAKEAFRIATADGSPPYISVDIDSIDPAYAPGTNSPEPGGLTSREIITALRIVGQNGFIGFDLVEVVPELDSAAGTTSILAARLIIEALGTLATAKKNGR